MDPTSIVNIVSDIVSDNKRIHFALVFLPLITFIFFNIHVMVICFYTIFLAIIIVYIHNLISLKEKVAKDYWRKEKQEEYIPYKYLFVLTGIIFIASFIISFILSIKGFIFTNTIYTLLLFLAHLFMLSYIPFLLLVLNYYKK